MPKITNIAEAKMVLQEVSSSVDALKAFFSNLEGVVGQLNAMSWTASHSPKAIPRPKAAANHEELAKKVQLEIDRRSNAALPGFQAEGKPITTVDRVLTIMRDLKKPLTPKEIVLEYERRKYPAPTSGNLYNAISGTVMYLFRRKGVVERTALRGKYFLSESTREHSAA